MANEDLGTLRYGIEVDTDGVDKGSEAMDKLQQESKKTGESFDKSTREVAGFTVATEKSTKSTKNFTAALKLNDKELQETQDSLKSAITYTAAFTAALGAVSASAASAGKELQNMSQLSGVSVEDFQRLAFGANEAGVSAEKLGDIYKDARDKMGDFSLNAGGELLDFFENVAPKVGVTADAFKNLTGPEVLEKLFATMEKANISGNEQINILESLANDASLLAPLLANNAQGFKEAGDRLDELGLVLTALDVSKLVQVDKAFNTLTTSVARGTQAIVADNAEDIIDAINSVVETIAEATKFLKENMDTIAAATKIIGTGAAAWYSYRAALVAVTIATAAFDKVTKATIAGKLFTAAGLLAGALWSVSDGANTASDSIDKLTGKTKELTQAEKFLLAVRLQDKAEEREKELAVMDKQIIALQAQRDAETDIQKAGRGNDEGPLEAMQRMAEKAKIEIKELKDQAMELRAIEITSGASVDAPSGPSKDQLENLEKILDKYTPLIKLQGDLLAEQNSLKEAYKTAADEDIPRIEDALEEVRKKLVAVQSEISFGDGLISDDIEDQYKDFAKIRAASDKAAKADQDELIDKYKDVGTELEVLQEDHEKLTALISNATEDEVADLEEALRNVGEAMADIQNPFQDWVDGIESTITSFKSLADAVGHGGAEMEVAIKAVQMAQAISAVLNQAQGDPYTAAGRMAAMAGAVAAIGGFAVSLGGLGGSIGSTYEARQEVQGTGSVFGMDDEKSNSILNAIEENRDATEELVGIQYDMLSKFENLSDSISGASSLIARDVDYGDFSGAQDMTNIIDQAFSGAGQLFDSAFLGLTDGLFEGLLSGIGGLLGGSSRVSDEGIQIIGGSIEDIINDTTALAYQDVKSKKYSWSSSKTKTATAAVSDALESQIDGVLTGIFGSVEASLSAIGFGDTGIASKLSEIIVETFEVSLKGLDAEEQAEELQAVFSKVFDEVAAGAAPELSAFQDVGEGMGETLARLGLQMQVMGELTRQTGIAELNGSLEDQIRITDELSEALGGAAELAESFTSFIDRFYTDEEKLANLQGGLSTALEANGLALFENEQQLIDYTKALDLNTDAGVENLATILELQDSLDDYYSMISDAAQGLLSDISDGIASQLEAASDELSDLTDSVNAQITAENERSDAALESMRDQQTALGESISNAESLINLLDSAMNTLAGFSEDLQDAVFARSFDDISAAIATAESTGELPTADVIEGAISSLSTAGTGNFATAVDQEREALKARKLLSDLNDLSDDQLTTDEEQLKSLDLMIENEELYNARIIEALEDQLDSASNDYDNLSDSLNDTFEELEEKFDDSSEIGLDQLSELEQIKLIMESMPENLAAAMSSVTAGDGLAGSPEMPSDESGGIISLDEWRGIVSDIIEPIGYESVVTGYLDNNAEALYTDAIDGGGFDLDKWEKVFNFPTHDTQNAQIISAINSLTSKMSSTLASIDESSASTAKTLTNVTSGNELKVEVR